MYLQKNYPSLSNYSSGAMKLVIIGTGPGALALASLNKKNPLFSEVTLLESREGQINPDTKISWPDGNSSTIEGCKITTKLDEAIPDANVILLCNPANSYSNILKNISDYVTPSTELICGVPGATGFDWMVRDAFAGKPKSFTVGAVESLPFIAKRSSPDKIQVHAIKQQLYYASSSFDKNDFKTSDLETILGVTLKKFDHFLSLTLLNPNGKVHPLLFLDIIKHSKNNSSRNIYDLSTDSAYKLCQIEKEVEHITSAITAKTGINLDPMPSLKQWFSDCYQDIIEDNSTAHSCLATHQIYRNLKGDLLKGINTNRLKETDEGKCRFLTEDVPYGLVCFKGLAELVEVKTPHIDEVLHECQRYLKTEFIANDKLIQESLGETSAPQRFGIKVLSKLNRLYQVHSSHKALEIKEFDDNGVVFFGKLLPTKKSINIQKVVSKKISNVDPVDTEKLLLNLHWTDQKFAEFCSYPELVSTACDLLKVNDVRIFSSLIVFKKPNEKMPVPWHQDPAYQWPIEPLDCVSFWFALDDVTPINGAMDMAIGGHKVGILPMRPTPPLIDGEYHFSPQLAESISEDHLKDFPLIKCDMLQYEISCHHSMMPHSSPLNLSQSRRAAFIVRYCKGHTKIKLYAGMPRENFFRNYKLYNPHKTFSVQ